MVEFTKGDMFEIAVDARVNTVNCMGVMGTGIALAFKNRYPDMFKDYQSACREGLVRPGNLHVWKSLTGDWVINFPTKRDWRDPSRYEDILSGLEALRTYLRECGPISVALPSLGCGHGGLDWDKVSSMIKNSLGDLEARILVFEPEDSRKAGHAVRDKTTEEQIKALELLGFRPSELSDWQRDEALTSVILSKGETALLARRWVALLPTRGPTDREMTALSAVARQMALSAESVAVALVYATRATERVAELFLNQGVGVVLILPFGPLSRKSVSRTATDKQRAPFVMASVAPPADPWGRAILTQSMRLLIKGASSILISDPAPNWLGKRSIHNWAEHAVFYLRYEDLADTTRRVLGQAGARPIGRRSDTGEPNLTPLFGVPPSSKHGLKETLGGTQHRGCVAWGSQPHALAESGATSAKELTVQREIDDASEFGRKLEELVVSRQECPAGVRDVMLIAYWSLILDYHKGILSLLRTGYCGSAFALVRPLVEALIRSHVVLMGSDDDVRKIRDDDYFVNFKTIGGQIDTTFGLDGFFERFLNGALDALHSFTHSGSSQLGRRFEGTDLKPAYSDEEIIEVIRTTTSAVFMTTNLVTKHFKFQHEAKTADELFTAWGKHTQ